jgi:hypothetical protein
MSGGAFGRWLTAARGGLGPGRVRPAPTQAAPNLSIDQQTTAEAPQPANSLPPPRHPAAAPERQAVARRASAPDHNPAATARQGLPPQPPQPKDAAPRRAAVPQPLLAAPATPAGRSTPAYEPQREPARQAPAGIEPAVPGQVESTETGPAKPTLALRTAGAELPLRAPADPPAPLLVPPDRATEVPSSPASPPHATAPRAATAALHTQAVPEAMVVHVSIGRVELIAAASPAPPRVRSPGRAAASVPLADYLRGSGSSGSSNGKPS